jgi:acetyl esterase
VELMPLSSDAQAVFDRLAAVGNPAVEQLGVEAARLALANWNRLAGVGPDMPTEDTTADGVPVRVYRPDGACGTLVWFHGGGLCLGSVDEHDGFCRRFARAAGTTVVNVEYRLAPEHPFPAGLDDCWTATRWAARTLDGPTGVGGDSAGGNLAAVVALKARDEGGPPLAYQLLVYPAVDFELGFPSIHRNGKGYFLYEVDIRWFRDSYLGDHDRRDPYASPIYAEDLSGLPPAYLVSAEYDPLRDETEAYARRLEEAGVPVTHRRYEGQMHAFFTAGDVYAAAQPALEEAAAMVARSSTPDTLIDPAR